MSFEYLGLSEGLLEAVRDAGYSEPTPIQRQAIPTVLMGRDVIGIAQTGTGKTAGFTLPMIDILSQGRAKARMPRSLILEPTRELAAQVSESFEKYGKNHKLTMALLIGGVSFADQEAKLERGVDVLIATPGRLLDHFGRGKLMLNGVQILVVDECDRMLDMGFIPDVENICSKMPQAHQTLFFSATLSKEIKRLTDRFLNDPKIIEVAPPASTAATVEQSVLRVGKRDKSKTLRTLIAGDEVQTAIVFCNRKVEVKSVYLSLKRAGLSVGQLHGDMAQPDRMDVLARFKAGEIKILVASDVAARGLDIPLVSHVFNYDVPHSPEDYVHRIGRTGRAGRKGVAVMIATPEDDKSFAAIENLIGRKVASAGDGGQPAAPVAAEVPAEASTPAEEQAMPEDDGKARRPRRRRRKSGAKAETPAPAIDPEAASAAAPEAPAARSDRPARRPRGRGKAAAGGGGEPARRDERDTPVVGLGDHVPAFLMRTPPVRRKVED